ncbi:MAG: hypothetical protein KF712_15350 [Akkermansiaceae bacterium]|nr:hypothetical protein [Akkermansiaceae bacterium]
MEYPTKSVTKKLLDFFSQKTAYPLVRSIMKIILQIIGGSFLIFATIAGFSSAKEWIILNNLSGYQKEVLTITDTRVVHRIGDDGTDYYLLGHGERGECEFAISANRYETLSSATAAGQKVTVYRNSSMPSIAFQKESASIIFEEDWRDRAEVAVSAKSTMWIAVIATVISIFAFVSAQYLSSRRTKTEQSGRDNRLKPVPHL